MFRQRFRKPYSKLLLVAAAAGLLSTGCGQQYVMLHPAGPVGRQEMHLMILASIAMAIVILIVFVLFFYALIRFRDKPGNTAPYRPDWHGHRGLEILWWVLPAVLLTVIAIPTVKVTYALDRIPKAKDPVVIDVTSLTWKWLFQYPGQHVATVNYVVIPSGEPVLFELTANSPMNTFWVPQLGGMEYTMPNRVLPLWLEANKPGTYWGHSGQFSGTQFEKMFFNVKAVPPAQFKAWAQKTASTAQPMTNADFKQLLKFNTVGVETYGNYPKDTFPSVASGFTLTGGGMYSIQRHKNGIEYVPMVMSR
ncbi:cytochrome c oxidase subunit II [Sulfobacillus harzensis]|uniref:Cytochrome c oxidase subunit 2 n=1 Tax=Sulfobacillus harzensis TaxID=2729629 RepID=A0A7Y0L082_9FIRM|nr:cytochrome c oxidase subunit II [Sulfobacillus harzensis]NMP20886.1 cytochrome c oxidase subunit II [Sulfobacillus harzensis]